MPSLSPVPDVQPTAGPSTLTDHNANKRALSDTEGEADEVETRRATGPSKRTKSLSGTSVSGRSLTKEGNGKKPRSRKRKRKEPVVVAARSGTAARGRVAGGADAAAGTGTGAEGRTETSVASGSASRMSAPAPTSVDKIAVSLLPSGSAAQPESSTRSLAQPKLAGDHSDSEEEDPQVDEHSAPSATLTSTSTITAISAEGATQETRFIMPKSRSDCEAPALASSSSALRPITRGSSQTPTSSSALASTSNRIELSPQPTTGMTVANRAGTLPYTPAQLDILGLNRLAKTSRAEESAGTTHDAEIGEADEGPGSFKGKGKAPSVERNPSPASALPSSAAHASQNQLLDTHQNLLGALAPSLTCQICLDLLYKPFALAPCGHVACYGCLVRWFSPPAPEVDAVPIPAPAAPVHVPAPVANAGPALAAGLAGPPPIPVPGPAPRDAVQLANDVLRRRAALRRRKTCPHCRAIVRERPAEVWVVKDMVATLVRSGLAPSLGLSVDIPLAPAADANGNQADPWADIFAPVLNHADAGLALLDDLHDFDDWDAGEFDEHDVGLLDDEDGGVYRCRDCLHEIWDGVCSSCGRMYRAHLPPDIPGPFGHIDYDDDEFDDDDDDEDDDDEGFPDGFGVGLGGRLGAGHGNRVGGAAYGAAFAEVMGMGGHGMHWEGEDLGDESGDDDQDQDHHPRVDRAGIELRDRFGHWRGLGRHGSPPGEDEQDAHRYGDDDGIPDGDDDGMLYFPGHGAWYDLREGRQHRWAERPYRDVYDSDADYSSDEEIPPRAGENFPRRADIMAAHERRDARHVREDVLDAEHDLEERDSDDESYEGSFIDDGDAPAPRRRAPVIDLLSDDDEDVVRSRSAAPAAARIGRGYRARALQVLSDDDDDEVEVLDAVPRPPPRSRVRSGAPIIVETDSDNSDVSFNAAHDDEEGDGDEDVEDDGSIRRPPMRFGRGSSSRGR